MALASFYANAFIAIKANLLTKWNQTQCVHGCNFQLFIQAMTPCFCSLLFPELHIPTCQEPAFTKSK